MRRRLRGMAVLESGKSVWVKKRQEPCGNHGQYIRRCTLNQLRLSRTPVKALELICKNDANHSTTLWQEHLKRISFDSGGNWTKQTQANLAVVGLWRDNQGRSSSSLLTTSLWGELQPDQVPTIRDIRRGHQKISAPTATPVSTEEWRFSAVTPARRTSRLRRVGCAGFTIKSPSLALRLTSVPAPRPICSARPRGIRTPRLFPHFWTRVCMRPQGYTASIPAMVFSRRASISLTPRSEAGKDKMGSPAPSLPSSGSGC